MAQATNPAIALVRQLRKSAVSVWVDEDELIHVMPCVLKPEDRALLQANKPEVVRWLRQYAANLLPDDATLVNWKMGFYRLYRCQENKPKEKRP